MKVLFYYNPITNSIKNYIYPLDNILNHLYKYKRINIYNIHAKNSTIVVKEQNLSIQNIELPLSVKPKFEKLHEVCKILNYYFIPYKGNLHTLNLLDYPEIFI